jgi:hypothetical protein
MFIFLMSVSVLSLQIFSIKFSHVVLKHQDCRKTKAPLEVYFGWKFSAWTFHGINWTPRLAHLNYVTSHSLNISDTHKDARALVHLCAYKHSGLFNCLILRMYVSVHRFSSLRYGKKTDKAETNEGTPQTPLWLESLILLIPFLV